LTGVTLTAEKDGTIVLARYGSGAEVKTLAGLVYFASNDSKSITIIDVEGASGDVAELREQMENTFGTGVTTANTATAQLAALSGNNESTSAETSVEGAKRYAEDLIANLDVAAITAGEGQFIKSVSQADGSVSATTADMPTVATVTEAGKPIIAVAEDKGTIAASAGTINAEYVNIADSADKFTATTVEGALAELKGDIEGLDYTGVTTGTGVYVTNVTEENGVVSATTAELPSSADTAVAKKVVIAVAEDKGQINVSRGEITSSGKTIVLTDNADGGINFEANVDGTTIIVDEDSGVMSVASSALVQYEGDNDTVQISAVSDGVRTVSSPLTIQKVTTGLSEEVKEEYHLVGASGTTIGDPVKIYKDSHIVSIKYQDDPEQEHYQNLIYTYLDASGATQVAYVDISELVLEAEFASGITVTNHVAHGVVDPTSETFLTVGADGFKLAGVQDAINSAVDALDATVNNNANSGHVGVEIVETDGKLVSVTVAEDNIADADDLAALSAKTVTEVASSNSSISAVSTAATDGTVSYDLVTDASKIKMTGFTAADSGFTAITSASTVTEAVKTIETEIIANEKVVSEALNDLNARIESGVASATTEVVEGTDAGNNLSISSGAAADGHTIYTINLSDVASATALTAEIAARKAVDGVNGDVYTADTNANYISGASTLYGADQALDTALKALSDVTVNEVQVNGVALGETNNAVNVQIASAPVTGLSASPITVTTDKSTGAVTLTFEDLDAGTY